MSETEWVEQMATALAGQPWLGENDLSVCTQLKLAYSSETISYGRDSKTESISFATDLAIVENLGDTSWKPRVVVEAKLGRITTHDAITYSQKAAYHRSVHPYLRYGIMLGNRRHYPLPGRLYRHGAQFDFMISFVGVEPSDSEADVFAEVLQAEVMASRTLEKILYESRQRNRDHFTVLHRKLIVK
jgi:hypothetical protein